MADLMRAAVLLLVLAVLGWLAVRRLRIYRRGRLIRLEMQEIGEMAVEAMVLTQVHSIHEARTLFGKAIPLMQSRCIFTYDVTVKAGFDFDRTEVRISERTRTVHVTIPPIRILSADVMPDSLVILDEHHSPFAKVTLEQINQAIARIRQEAVAQAERSSIIPHARLSAQARLETFLARFCDPERYRIVFRFADQPVQPLHGDRQAA